MGTGYYAIWDIGWLAVGILRSNTIVWGGQHVRDRDEEFEELLLAVHERRNPRADQPQNIFAKAYDSCAVMCDCACSPRPRRKNAVPRREV